MTSLYANLDRARPYILSILRIVVALLFLQNPNDRTVTVGIALLDSGKVTSIPILMAGSVISVIPPIIVYLLFQKHLVRGITLGLGK